jgi:hypothetical protein
MEKINFINKKSTHSQTYIVIVEYNIYFKRIEISLNLVNLYRKLFKSFKK